MGLGCDIDVYRHGDGATRHHASYVMMTML